MPYKYVLRKGRIWIAAFLILPVVLVAIPAVIIHRAEAELNAAFERVSHTLEVQDSVRKLFTQLGEAQSESRAFIFTGEALYAENFDSSIHAAIQELDKVHSLTADNSSQQARIAQLKGIVSRLTIFLKANIALRQAGSIEEAAAAARSRTDEAFSREIAGVLQVMTNEEVTLLTARGRTLSEKARISKAVVWSMLAFCLLFLCAALYLIYRLLKAETYANICAWSKTIEFENEWISFEEYLRRRFGIDASHGIAPREAERVYEKYVAEQSSEKKPSPPFQPE